MMLTATQGILVLGYPGLSGNRLAKQITASVAWRSEVTESWTPGVEALSLLQAKTLMIVDEGLA